MELFWELLMNGTIISWLVALGGGIASVSAITIKVHKWLENYRKIKNETEKKDELIDKTIEDVTELKSDVKNLVKIVEVLSEKIDEEQKRVKVCKQAELKNDIKQIYHKCYKQKEISHMDLNTLKDLIAQYEGVGGMNSFVHSVVEKEMYMWNEVED